MKISSPSLNIALFTSFFLAFGAIALVIFPPVGMWHLIDAQKMLAGGILYQDVKTVTPPLYYLLWLPFVALGIKSMLFYRFLGVIELSTTFVVYYWVLARELTARQALFVVAVVYLIYIQVPWEMFTTYMYLSSIFAILSLRYFWRKPSLSAVFLGLALGLKVTIGGSLVIGYALMFIICGLLALGGRRRFYTGKWARRLFGGVAVLGLTLILPLLSFYVFGTHVSMSDLFSQIFSGESKGGALASLPRPFLSFVHSLQGLRQQTDTHYGLTPFRLIYSYAGISLMMPMMWLAAAGLFAYRSVALIYSRRLNRVVYYFPLVVSALGATYASAMSGNFKPDDIFIFSYAVILAYRYLRPGLSQYLLFSLIIIPILFFACFMILVGAVALIWILLAAYPVKYLYQKYGLAGILMPLLLISTFYLKMYQNTFAWWEHNIRGKNVSDYSHGFFATPYYAELVNKLTALKMIADSNKIDSSVLSFPTSSTPYHLFGYLPPWHYTVHHGDVFPKSQVGEEFQIISRHEPNFIVISRWTADKIKEFDAIFAPGSMSSQHELSILLDQLIARDYVLCTKVIWRPEIDTHNFNSEIYVKKTVYRQNLPSLLKICRSNDDQKL